MSVIPLLCVITMIGKENTWKRIPREEAIRYVETTDAFEHETHSYSYLSFLTQSKRRGLYPECDYYIATVSGQDAASKMIRDRVGELIGFRF
jgi:hypothetical protein